MRDSIFATLLVSPVVPVVRPDSNGEIRFISQRSSGFSLSDRAVGNSTQAFSQITQTYQNSFNNSKWCVVNPFVFLEKV